MIGTYRYADEVRRVPSGKRPYAGETCVGPLGWTGTASVRSAPVPYDGWRPARRWRFNGRRGRRPDRSVQRDAST